MTLGDIFYRRGKNGDNNGLSFPIFQVVWPCNIYLFSNYLFQVMSKYPDEKEPEKVRERVSEIVKYYEDM